MTKIGLIGCGMWGRNLARNLAQLDALHCVADLSPANADAFAAQFDTVALSVDDLIANKEIVGVALATSAPSHVALGIRVLAAGKHLYVEKPLTLTLADALEIEAAATAANKQVMVGHLIRYHAAFQEFAIPSHRWRHRSVAACAGKPVGNGPHSQHRICPV